MRRANRLQCPAMTDVPIETMQCMEVWGGNQPVSTSVVLEGMQAWVYSRPYTGDALTPADGGGDVYYASSCATGRITRLLVADVSGHGVEVKEVASSLRLLMRKYVNYLDPLRFVREMNRQFAELSQLGNFATAIVTTFFAPTNVVTFCNAGHPPPLLFRPGEGWRYLDSSLNDEGAPVNLPLGIQDGQYSEFQAVLRDGDLVLAYTDGLPESRAAGGDFLGPEGLLDIVQTLDTSHPQTLVPDLVHAIERLHPGNLTQDDITLLLFRPSGMGHHISFKNHLLAPWRLGAALVMALFPGGGPAPWPDHHPANVGGMYFSPLSRLWKLRKKARSARGQ